MELTQIDDFRWEIKKEGPMRVPARIYSSGEMIETIKKEETFKQLVNVAQLPGIINAALAMPDIHWGYGFPIGGVAGFDCDEGVISPGGVGYDINCGVRLAATSLTESEIRPHLQDLVNALFTAIPSGVGSTSDVKLSYPDLKKVLKTGSAWTIRNGYGDDSDIIHTEDHGCMEDADPAAISQRALDRGKKQLGTLGSGNHFLEIGVVEKIYDEKAARIFGLSKNHITVMLHTGSRGLGYQVCDDFLASMTKQIHKHGIPVPDRQLACAKIKSPAGEQYYRAMSCAANFAWANRQVLMHNAKNVLMRVFNISPRDLAMRLVYDVCHNIAKFETHEVAGKKQQVCVHRKGATRSFPPGHPALSDDYQDIGQPILIPGDMGTASYVLAGTQKSMDETFGSTCHGAGRVLSRTAAKKAAKGRPLKRELEDKGIYVRWTGRSTMAEEMPDAYKDISQVVDVVHGSGISKKVAKLRPIAVVKG
ncbi:MAG: RtcB family protein [Desulfobacteraceae bacterium]|nr:RtcB family protein [Desulfobacteraceae bacterium]MBC2756061.1 RtcB family protein [Desulfobacteraceae bacterium]